MSERKCGEPACFRMVWPSMQVIPVCIECLGKSSAIADAMGFRIGLLPAEPDDTCAQMYSERRGEGA